MIILKGRYPAVEKEIEFSGPVEAVIVASDAAQGYRLKPDFNRLHSDTIHYVRSSGAFRRRL